MQSLMSAERWQEAVDLLEGNADTVENDWKLSWNLGWCYFKLKKMSRARDYMERSTKIAPPDHMHSCKFGLGITLLMSDQNAKASILLLQSLRLKESYPARLSLALSYMKMGKLKQAEQVHLEGLALKPHSAERHRGYADFLSDVGREEEAQKLYRKADALQRIH